MSTTAIRNLALKQHFTDAKPINEMMCHLLGTVEGLSVLEPSVGHGAFLGGFTGKPALLDVVDVDSHALSIVASQFQHFTPRIFHEDFIDLFVEGLMKSSHPVRTTLYDRVISNPPYGLYFDLSYRKRIKEAFPDLYARESYGLFFAFAVSRLRERGRYVFLLPDTFLSSVNHRSLRSFICAQAAPTHFIRFPSKLFETVNFGYGNLCIVVGEKRPIRNSDTVYWLDLFAKDTSLTRDSLCGSEHFPGSILKDHCDFGWSSAMFTAHGTSCGLSETLGDVAECRTGIYTGDNERFIGYDAARIIRRLNGHSIDWSLKVQEDPLTPAQKEAGLHGERCYVPFIRGGHREAFEKTAWAINWSPEAIDFYRTNKKARLQNSRFYFRTGISVPMVTTKRISAGTMCNAVFDQGVVGVFPKHSSDSPALLLYLNSSLASERMKTLVNGSANNSANYLKRLPVPHFSHAALERADHLVNMAAANAGISLNQTICDEFVEGC
jgi:predicted RNA methylase